MTEEIQATPETGVHRENTPVRLKGMGSSLCVTLDPVDPLDYLKEELVRLFSERRQLAANASVLIDVGASDGFDDVVEELGAFLKEKFSVGSVSRPARKNPEPASAPPVFRTPDEEWLRTRDMNQSWNHYRTDVLMLSGRVRSGQKVTARRHLLILGDVNPGAEVMAGGDILIMGTLLGTAIAGQPDNEDSIILALDFRPTQIQIGSYVAAGLPSSPVKTAEFAHVEGGNLVVENYLAASPFSRLPWPQVR